MKDIQNMVDPSIVDAVMPYISAGAGTLTAAALSRTGEGAAEVAANRGRRLLQWLTRHAARPEAIEEAASALDECPTDEERVITLRDRIADALAAEPTLESGLREVLSNSGARVSNTTHGPNSPIIKTVKGGLNYSIVPQASDS